MDSHKKDVPYKWELTSVAASKKRKNIKTERFDV